MPKLTFTKAGRIQVHSHGSPDGYLGDPGEASLLRHLRSAVVIEEGVTASTIIRALRPWGAEISEMGWLDFDAWDKTISRSHLRVIDASRSVDPDEPEVVAVILKAEIRVISGDTGKGVPCVSTDWDLLGLYRDDDPRKPTGHDYCSLSLAYPDEWGQLPLRIDTVARVIDQRRRKDGVMPDTIEVEPAFFDTIVMGLFDNMSICGGPDETMGERRGLIEIVAALKAGELEGRDLDDVAEILAESQLGGAADLDQRDGVHLDEVEVGRSKE